MTTSDPTAALAQRVTQAAARLPRVPALPGFVALDPLVGLHDRAIDDAYDHAAHRYGAVGTFDEDTFRALHRAGRITDHDLDTAIVRWATHLADVKVPLGSGKVEAVGVVAALLTATTTPDVPPAQRRPATAAEHGGAADLVRHALAVRARDLLAGGTWRTWRNAAHRDLVLRTLAGRRGARALADQLPGADVTGAVACLGLLDRLGIGPDAPALDELLDAHLTLVPGWAARLAASDPRLLLDWFAVALAYEVLLDPGRTAADASHAGGTAEPDPTLVRSIVASLGGAGAADEAAVATVLSSLDLDRRRWVWQDAYELAYRRHLLEVLATQPTPLRPGRPFAQVVCCIDTRSEGLRRHLEADDDVETFGFAGFFGLTVAVQPLGADHPAQHCPVILEPTMIVREDPPAPGVHDTVQATEQTLADAYHTAALQPSAFTVAEAMGMPGGIAAAARTFAPGVTRSLATRWARFTGADRPGTLSLGDVDVSLAAGILRAIGLTEGFAPLVVLCGHASRHPNNPYRAGLNCGACAGQAGGANARLLAELLNRPQVRAALAADHGIVVPADTRFVAAEHETTADRVTLLDVADADPGLAELRARLDVATAALRAERAPSLPGGQDPGARAADWSQVAPEWGLANNAAMIVAHRSALRGLDLGRRTFLHGYHATADPDATILATILGGPVVVAQGISAAYAAAVTDPAVFGAGSKTRHNVVDGDAVLEGAAGDLRSGLPLECVWDGAGWVHEPMRLLVVIDAPPAHVDRALAAAPDAAALVDGSWIRVLARADAASGWQERLAGTWTAPSAPVR